MSEQYVTNTVAIKIHNDEVVLEFPKPILAAGFNANTAKDIGMEMTKLAYKLSTGADAAPNQIITRETEAKLLNRLTLAITDMQKKGELPAIIANNVMGIVLREVS